MFGAINGVIRRHDQQQNVIAVLFPQIAASGQSGKRDGRSGAARLRLEDDAAFHVFRREGRRDVEAVILVADDKGRFSRRDLRGAFQGIPEERVPRVQFDKLFGIFCPRQRPQSGAAAAAEDNGTNAHDSFLPYCGMDKTAEAAPKLREQAAACLCSLHPQGALRRRLRMPRRGRLMSVLSVKPLWRPERRKLREAGVAVIPGCLKSSIKGARF